jgi:alpha-galactosidase
MLVAGSRWLPQYKQSISAARRRLAKGPRIKTKITRGAARVKTRSVAELARQNPRAGH